MIVPIITIDGPVGTGKSSVACCVAQKLGFNYLNSGVLYRVAASYVLRETFKQSQMDQIIKALLEDDIVFEFDRSHADGYVIKCNGRVISDEVTSQEAGALASTMSQSLELRRALIEKQRSYATKPGLVTDGRDMGSTIFPNANTKIFLTAVPEVRALRRYQQLINKGLDVNIDKVREDIIRRDYNDSNRKISPLTIPLGAHMIDSSNETFTGVVEKILDICKQVSDASASQCNR